MSTTGEDRLYKLLPAIYRIRDEERGQPPQVLQALLSIIEEQYNSLDADIRQLYEDWFIETCADWVVPYIGDLVGNKPLHEVAQLRRTDVAKTIHYRRRKGTAAMLEEMARDVTGWGAHVVEFFELLGWTQNINHLRFQKAAQLEPDSPPSFDRVGTVNIRSLDVIDRLNGPFDIISHTIDIRPICGNKGRYNIRKIGFFLWRLEPYTLEEVTPKPVPGHPYCYTFSRLGNKAPLFNQPQREAEDTRLATEVHVPGPIRPLAFDPDMMKAGDPGPDHSVSTDCYGPAGALYVVKNGVQVKAEDVVGMNLSGFGQPCSSKVAIDVRNGLISFPTGEEPEELSVSSTYGFSTDMGGGPYERRQDMVDYEAVASERLLEAAVIDVAQDTAEHPGAVASVREALDDVLDKWTENDFTPCVIRILDNGVYDDSNGAWDIALPDRGWLMIEAANGVWPDLRPTNDPAISVTEGTATLIIDGMLMESALRLNGGLDLTLQHCTLVPGRTLDIDGKPGPGQASLTVETASDDLAVAIKDSVVGPIRMPESVRSLTIQDSIVQAPPEDSGEARCAIAADEAGDEPGPPTILDRTTVFGTVHVKELTRASETIFTAEVKTQRQQNGCVRFSYVPFGSLTPRRHRCQPETALAKEAETLGRPLTVKEKRLLRARLEPQFSSKRYGEPAYAQLRRSCAEEIHKGAEDGSEMGAFASLKQPQREANLRIRLEEYLPFGLEAGLIFVT
jgi:hypothetical protein